MHRLLLRQGAWQSGRSTFSAGRSTRVVTLMASSMAAGFAAYQLQKEDSRLAWLAGASQQEPASKWSKLPSPTEKTVEKVSGVEFSNAIVREEGGEKMMRLCATSIRCMLGMCWLNRARAYAFGIYLGSSTVEDLVVEGKGDLESINPRPDAKNALGDAPFYPSAKFTTTKEGYYFTRGPSGLGYYRDDKSPVWTKQKKASPILIRLVMLQDIDGEHLAHGFEKTFKSRITPELDPSKACLAQINQFTNALRKIEKLPKGAQVDL